jgi:hypothetical protein
MLSSAMQQMSGAVGRKFKSRIAVCYRFMTRGGDCHHGHHLSSPIDRRARCGSAGIGACRKTSEYQGFIRNVAAWARRVS